MSLSPLIASTCRAYFGRNVVRAGRKQLVDNRCEKCPLREPCVTFCAAPARTFGELEQARETFASAAVELLGAPGR